MTTFIGTGGNDTANAVTGELDEFTGGSDAELQDLVNDFFAGGGGEDFVFAGDGGDRIEGGEGRDELNGGAGNASLGTRRPDFGRTIQWRH
jgi:Ca2+-binding RTX toxin-like protein